MMSGKDLASESYEKGEDGVRGGKDDEDEGIEACELDPVLVDIAEKTTPREAPVFQR